MQASPQCKTHKAAKTVTRQPLLLPLMMGSCFDSKAFTPKQEQKKSKACDTIHNHARCFYVQLASLGGHKKFLKSCVFTSSFDSNLSLI